MKSTGACNDEVPEELQGTVHDCRYNEQSLTFCIIQNIGLKLQFQSLFLINLFHTICEINSLNKMQIEAEYQIEW